jgi:histidyl-tRNA synthetase
MAFKKIPVKGMCDVLPSEMRLREEVLALIRESYAKYGFEEIKTPAMEPIENLQSKQGGENEKLIFKVMKRGAELMRALEKADGELADCGMRYDLTVPLARYYANNAAKLVSPFKSLQIGDVWRADNPQKGRFRQFMQCDIDVLGDDTNFAEIELITATANMLGIIFSKIGDVGFTVHVNDRKLLIAVGLSTGFSEEETASLLISLDKLDKIGFDGVESELLEKGYDEQKVKKYLQVYQTVQSGVTPTQFAAAIGEEYLAPSVVQNLEEIIACAASAVKDSVQVVFDPTLVRGMGYYTGPIFEITAQNYGFSVAGGGRYDKMVGKFAGQDVPAVGFSIGFERIVTILKDFERADCVKIKGDGVAFLLDRRISTEKKMEIFRKAQDLRAQGYTVTVAPMKKNLKFQIDELMKVGYQEVNRVYAD